MSKIYNIEDLLLKGKKVISVELPEEMDIDLDQARIDRKRAGIKKYKKVDIIREGIAIILEAHHELKKYDVHDTLNILRKALRLHLKLAGKFAKERKLSLKKALGEDMEKWIDD